MVSEIGLSAEWLERHSSEECVRIVKYCEEQGINILDCWISEPNELLEHHADECIRCVVYTE